MAIEEAALHHFGNQSLVEARAVQIGGLFSLQELGHERGWGDQKAQPQTGGQHLGERTQVNAAFGVACRHGQGRRCVKPQVAIGVVFHNRQADFGGGLRQLYAACFAHAAASRILKVGQQVDEAGFVGTLAGFAFQIIHQHAFVVARHAVNLGLHRHEGLQGTQVGGRFHQHAAAFVDQHLGDQIEPLLRTGGDQNVFGFYLPGQTGGHHVAQRAIPFAG